jgi:response regulator RpfG family c-di-GMP phosphodiesterase
MQPRHLIVCVDDEREILDSVSQDLNCFEELFFLESALSVDEAQEVINEYQEKGIPLALILCDHIMPQKNGIQFLIELNAQPETEKSRKLLLTGQAGLDDTVDAINHASLDFYISKPWDGDQLRKTIKQQLTQYIIETESDLLPWMSALDTEAILNAIAAKRTDFGE